MKGRHLIRERQYKRESKLLIKIAIGLFILGIVLLIVGG